MPKKQAKSVVLLVASSSNNLRLVGQHLEPYFKVMTASDAESAWEALLEFDSISLVISELELVNDGFGLLERLRNASDSWLAATPLLLLVGENDDDSAREHAFLHGATDFINLPFASSELTARVRLHANLYLQQTQDPENEMHSAQTGNLLQRLSQQNFFISRVQQEISFSQRHRSSISLCKLKLDKVKAMIDEFDKTTAIAAVKALAQMLQQTLRREDRLCYLGNAEFYLLYPATNGIDATAAVNRIVKSVSGNHLTIDGKKVPVTLSGAIYSCIASSDTELEKIEKNLDQSLAQARARGGNQIVSCTSATQDRVISVDRALRLIDIGKTEDLSEHAAPLLLRLLPLLEFADDVLQLGLDSVSRDLRARLSIEPGTDKTVSN